MPKVVLWVRRIVAASVFVGFVALFAVMRMIVFKLYFNRY